MQPRISHPLISRASRQILVRRLVLLHSFLRFLLILFVLDPGQLHTQEETLIISGYQGRFFL
jgi:hypothetical protein